MNSTKLVLVIPPQVGLLRGFATGLISLATYIEQELLEIQVEIIDLSGETYPAAELIIRQMSLNADNIFVGITTTTGSYQSSLQTAHFFKKKIPACKVIFGGHHAANDPENILTNHPEIVDYIIIGEGEIALAALLLNYPNLDAVPSLAYRNNSGEVVKNPLAHFLTVEELDRISLSYHETKLYGSPGKFDAITYVSARGCPLKCTFCAVANEKMRSKSVGKVAADIQQLAELGYRNIAIEDNFFAHSPKRTRELCKALITLRQEESLDFMWDCQTRVESVLNPEIVNLMSEAGCYAVYIGVEALDKENLLYLGKTSVPEKYVEQLVAVAIPNILNTAIQCYINLQFGLPTQFAQHIEEMLSVLKILGEMAAAKNKYITVFPQLHVVYPGTTHFRQGCQQGRFSKAVFEYFTVWEEQQQNLYRWMGENFAHGTGGIPEGIMDREKLRQNEFEMDNVKIAHILGVLQTIKNIAGIRVFEYNTYLN